jgi:hypothetical protein
LRNVEDAPDAPSADVHRREAEQHRQAMETQRRAAGIQRQHLADVPTDGSEI